ncbi:MAG: class I SAM-dependent RNA methyltransferase [Pyrinomonadaceae bacterium]
MDPEYKENDLIEVTVQKIVPRGLGLAFLPGLTVFVPLAAEGDRLAVRLNAVKGKTATAEIERIIEASDDRVTPPCRHFGICGGCDLQHLRYETQLMVKVEIIKDCLTRIGKLGVFPEIEVRASPMPFGYRSRAQWQIDGSRRTAGYNRRGSHEVVDIDECLVLVPELQHQLGSLRAEAALGRFPAQLSRIDASSGDGEAVSLDSSDLVLGAHEIAVSASGDLLHFTSRVFFQGNPFLLRQLVETAVGDATGKTALDLYCGVGLFTLPLARRFESVVGVEESEEAIGFARRNSAAAGLGNINFRARRVRNYLGSYDGPRPDLVLLDPPRSGTEKGTVRSLIGLEPSRISYVSCDPAMLARDVRTFTESGYAIDSIAAIDLFPQTHHVETVVLLHRDR